MIWEFCLYILKYIKINNITLLNKDKVLNCSYLNLTASNPDYHEAPAIQKMLKSSSYPEQQYRDYLRITEHLQKRRF
ncbi:conserved hypothetical protein [Xenorhabdus nematophila str. Websteri]|nr:conserved hypothetical protein [Xenorhabdus nematophila str. Websteri]